jgi:hypothetical protein
VTVEDEAVVIGVVVFVLEVIVDVVVVVVIVVDDVGFDLEERSTLKLVTKCDMEAGLSVFVLKLKNGFKKRLNFLL